MEIKKRIFLVLDDNKVIFRGRELEAQMLYSSIISGLIIGYTGEIQLAELITSEEVRDELLEELEKEEKEGTVNVLWPEKMGGNKRKVEEEIRGLREDGY